MCCNTQSSDYSPYYHPGLIWMCYPWRSSEAFVLSMFYTYIEINTAILHWMISKRCPSTDDTNLSNNIVQTSDEDEDENSKYERNSTKNK